MSNGGSSGGRGCNADWVKVENDLFELAHKIKPIFKEIRVFKPSSSRKDSKEIFIICKILR